MSTKKKGKATAQQPKRDKSGRFASKCGKAKKANKKPTYNKPSGVKGGGRPFCGMDFGEGDGARTYWCSWEVLPKNETIPFDPKGECLNGKADAPNTVNDAVREIERLNRENKALTEETIALDSRVRHYRERKNSYKTLASLMRYLLERKDKRIADMKDNARLMRSTMFLAGVLSYFAVSVVLPYVMRFLNF